MNRLNQNQAPDESQENYPGEASEGPQAEAQEAQSGMPSNSEESAEGGMGDDESAEGTEAASPEDEQELQRAQGALGKILYQNEAGFNSVVEKLKNPNVPPINKLTDTTIFLVTEIDKKININEGVILPFVGVVYGALYEIAQTANAFELPDAMIKKGLMATIQVALQAYGVSEEEFNEYAESIGQDGAAKLIKFYQGEHQ